MCRRDMPNIDVHYITREGRSPLDDIEQSIGLKDGPPRNYDFVNAELLDVAAQAGVRVIMDGHGGDYTINPRGNAFLAWLLKKWQLRSFVREFFAHRRATRHPYWKITRHAGYSAGRRHADQSKGNPRDHRVTRGNV
jgi:asparagine synthase (glutamine-hydrolysing)